MKKNSILVYRDVSSYQSKHEGATRRGIMLYLEYQSVCLLVRIGSPRPLSVYLGPRVKCRRIVEHADRSSQLSLAESALVRGIPLSYTNSGNTRHMIGIRRLNHTHNFAFPPTHPEEGPTGRRRRARPAQSVTLSSLPGQPDITPIFPHSFPVLVKQTCSQVSYPGMQAGVADPGGWYTGRSGREPAVSDPTPSECVPPLWNQRGGAALAGG